MIRRRRDTLQAIGRGRRAPTTIRSYAVRTGRFVLWLTVALVLIRGITATLERHTTTSTAAIAKTAAVTRDDTAERAFAADFARAYLSARPGAEGQQRAELERFTSPDLAGGMLADVEHRQVVQAVQITRARARPPGRSLITVAARVQTPDRVQVIYLAVPIARDQLGRLAVADLPSLDSPPRRGAPPEPTETLHATPAPVVDVLTRFMRAYLAGDTPGLTFLTPPDVHIDALTVAHDLAGQLTARTIEQNGRAITVLVDVNARDRATRALYALRYRIELVRRDRWLVKALNPPETP